MSEGAGQTWFIRSNGKIRGPFSQQQLESLKNRGRLNVEDELSLDRRNWLAASDTVLFQGASAAGGGDAGGGGGEAHYSFQQAAFEQPVQQQQPAQAGTGVPGQPVQQAAPKPVMWFYSADGQNQQGPVDTLTLQGLTATGQVTPDTLVWKEGLSAWLPIKDVPEISGHAAVAAAPAGQSGLPPRDPGMPAMLGYPTCGIYVLIWLRNTANEMRAVGAQIPPFWYYFTPLAPLFYWRWCHAVEQTTQKRVAWPIPFFFNWFPYVPYLVQKSLNEAGVHPLGSVPTAAGQPAQVDSPVVAQQPGAIPVAQTLPSPGLSKVGTGLQIILWGLCGSFFGLFVAAAARATEPAAILVGLGIFLVGNMVQLIGKGFCATAPAGQGLAYTSLGLDAFGFVGGLGVVLQIFSPEIGMAANLMGIAGTVLFVLFCKTMSRHIGSDELQKKCSEVLIILGCVGGGAVMAGIFAAADVESAALGFSALAGLAGLIWAARYVALLFAMQKAVR